MQRQRKRKGDGRLAPQPPGLVGEEIFAAEDPNLGGIDINVEELSHGRLNFNLLGRQ